MRARGAGGPEHAHDGAHPRALLLAPRLHRAPGGAGCARRQRGQRRRCRAAHRPASLSGHRTIAAARAGLGRSLHRTRGAAQLRRPDPRQPDPLREHGRPAEVLPRRHRRGMALRRPQRHTGWRIHVDEQPARGAGDDAAVDGAAPAPPRRVARRRALQRGRPRPDAHRRNAYGASHLAADPEQTEPSDDEATIARRLGRRVAEIAVRLKGWEDR